MMMRRLRVNKYMSWESTQQLSTTNGGYWNAETSRKSTRRARHNRRLFSLHRQKSKRTKKDI